MGRNRTRVIGCSAVFVFFFLLDLNLVLKFKVLCVTTHPVTVKPSM